MNKKNILIVCFVTSIACACQESLPERCARECKEYTEKKCPVPCDEFSTLDSITFDASTLTLHHHYTLKGAADDSARIASTDARGGLISQLKNSTAMKVYKDNGYNFAYTYRSQRNPQQVLFTTTLTDSDYR